MGYWKDRMETVVCGDKVKVVIGKGRPLTVIGERINPTGNRRLRESLEQGGMDVLIEEAKRQVEEGAHILDVNVGLSGLDEVSLLVDAISAIQEILDVPLSIDSANVKALRAGLEVYKGKAIVNSVNGEERKLKDVLPLVKEYGANVIGLSMDERGIPSDPEERLRIAERILNQAEKMGLRSEDIIIDPICTSLASDHNGAMIALRAIELINKRLGINTTIGISNVSYGLPYRATVNSMFLAVAMYCGLSSAILDPTSMEIKKTIYICNMLLGKDEFCMEYIRFFRKTQQ